MPCRSDYLAPTERERESGRVLEFLKELAGQPFNHDKPDIYGRVDNLDADTARLCTLCQSMGRGITLFSLDVQLWWEKHQKADKIRMEQEKTAAEKAALREVALAKLTPEERKALGLK